MRYIFLAIVMIASISNSIAQTVSVIDQETKEPLDLVTIGSVEHQIIVITEEDGTAQLDEFNQLDRIEIRKVGYETIYLSYEEIAETQFIISLAQAQIELSQIIVSASKWAQTKKEVPARVTTITAEEVALNNPQTAADLLASSGEVYIQKSQLGGGSPMIRGFSTNRLLISVDGVRMNNAIFRSGNLQNVISLDPQATEAAEVLFGPGSVIYGSDAIGGVMSFRSLTPWLSFTDETRISAKVLARYATANNEKTVHGHIKLGWQKWAIVSSITYSDFGDLRMGKNGPEEYLRPWYVEPSKDGDNIIPNNDPLVQRPTGYEQLNIMEKIRFRPNKHLDFVYSFHLSKTSDVPRYDRLIRTRNGDPRSAEWYYGPQQWQMHHFETTLDHKTSMFDKVSLRAAFQGYKESRHDRNLNDEILSEKFENVDALSLNIDALKTLGDRDKLYYGIEAVHNKVTSTAQDMNIQNGSTSLAAARYPKSNWYSLAGYLTYQRTLSKLWTMQAGARFNHIGLNATFDQTFFPFPFSTADLDNSAFTGSIGFVYTPNSKWTGRGSASSGFRSPNVDDVGKVFDSEPGAVVVPNADLKPEYAYNIEMSITHDWSKGCSAFLNGYYTQLEKALVRRNFTLNGMDSIIYAGELSQVQAIQNAANANVYGIEVGLDMKFTSGLGGKLRYNFQRGEEELDDGSISASRHAPPPFGLAAINYQNNNLFVQLVGSFNAAKTFEQIPVEERRKTYQYATDENGMPWSPGWATLSFKSSYQVSKGFMVTLGVENILNKRYRPYSSGIVAAGRNLIVSASYSIE